MEIPVLPSLPSKAEIAIWPSQQVEFVIELPYEIVIPLIERAPLEQLIYRRTSIPFVVSTQNLNSVEFIAEGNIRKVNLSDNSSAFEGLYAKQISSDSFRFSYIVWNYTSTAAEPIDIAIGEFDYIRQSQGRTLVRWKYSFSLKPHKFPGSLGKLGHFIFTHTFLRRTYRKFMNGTAENIKEYCKSKS